jgi:hypothetical protein
MEMFSVEKTDPFNDPSILTENRLLTIFPEESRLQGADFFLI